MRYAVEDTADGYRMLLYDRFGAVRRVIDEPGGHGPIEQAYASAERSWGNARKAQIARRVGPIRDVRLDDCDGEPSGLVIARVRVVNRHGYVCEPRYVTCAWPGDEYDKRSLSEMIRTFATIGFPSASEVVILDAARVPRGATGYRHLKLNLHDVAGMGFTASEAVKVIEAGDA